MKPLDRTLAVLGLLLLAPVSMAAAGPDLWLHVKVEEAGGARVSVNLPIAVVEKAVPLLPATMLAQAHLELGAAEVDLEELRAVWHEVQESADATFVTVEDGDETVRVWKEGGWVYVTVRDGDDEEVDVKVPNGVVDALLAGEELDVAAAVRALVEHGQGEFVTVRDRDDTVRVWVDDLAESE